MSKVLKSIGKLQRGQGGFTLIELLVVVAILGVIAAVVILNVGGFIGAGTQESANTEAHQVQTAIISCMAVAACNHSGGSLGPNTTATGTPSDYLMNPGLLQATYAYNITTGAVYNVTGNNGKWADCSFNVTTGWLCP